MRFPFRFPSFFLSLLLVVSGAFWSPSFSEERPRPYYEAPADYREQINRLKEKFKQDYGYELMDLEEGWKGEEIRRLDEAFAQLPETFYRLPGLKGFYRQGAFSSPTPGLSPEEVPAGTFPSFITIYNNATRTYTVRVNDEDPRVEFYNPLFYEDREDFTNIVQHEMAHALDLARGFLSFSREWISLTHFRIVHIPALDGKRDSDFLYALLNDPAVDRYAPVARRHLPTYSQQSIQEDFANSAAAYIHYPYFRYSHPQRYRFLKDKVFGGKEYFSPDESRSSYQEKILADLDTALKEENWEKGVRIAEEAGRSYAPEVEAEIVRRLRRALEGKGSPEKDLQLGLASCFLYDPGALELRKDLIRAGRVSVQTFLKNPRCARMGRAAFESLQAQWAPMNVYFYREAGRPVLQFLDPVLRVAYSRGFKTRYLWRIFLEGSETKPVAEGNVTLSQGGNGTVRIDLGESLGRELFLPEGRVLLLEVGAQRYHPRTFKNFNSKVTRIRFITHAWFEYLGPPAPEIQRLFPLRPAFLHQH